jgi:hypothetical protein
VGRFDFLVIFVTYETTDFQNPNLRLMREPLVAKQNQHHPKNDAAKKGAFRENEFCCDFLAHPGDLT